MTTTDRRKTTLFTFTTSTSWACNLWVNRRSVVVHLFS